MSVLALRLAGPLQSWGSGSRFVRRTTEPAPTKSGVLGLIAAAKGLRRTEPIEELLQLRFAVRLDQPGQLVRDFQTAQRPVRDRQGAVTWKALPLSFRYYLADGVYVALLEGREELLRGIDAAVRSPAFPLYLGRRSCPPAGPLSVGVLEASMADVSASLPWQATARHQKSHREHSVQLQVVRDALPEEIDAELIRDAPLSFDPSRRQYAWRPVVREFVNVTNPHGRHGDPLEHDPMSMLRT